MLRPAHYVGRVGGQDLADHHLVEEHPQRGQPLFHGGLGPLPELVFDEGRDVDRLDLGEILNAAYSAERGELPDGFQVRAAGILVADVGAEEVAQPLAGLGPDGEERGQGSGRSPDKDLHSRHSTSILTHDNGHYHA